MLWSLARLTAAMSVMLLLACAPDAARAASAQGQQIAQQSSESAAAKSEAAEAWDAVKDTKNQALLEAFIARYGTTFFAEIAKARLNQLKTAAAKPHPQAPALPPMPKDGVRERAVLYEEDPASPTGDQFDGSVIWRTETIKTAGQPDELAAHADVDIPSRGLRMTMTFKRNLDSSLPASHVFELKFADVDGRGITNVPGILLKTNEKARGTPLAGLSVKVTDGFFLDGISNVKTDRARNLKLLAEYPWFDIPIVYTNQRRAILALDKGETGLQLFKTLLAAWGQSPEAPQAAPPDQPNNDMPEEWRRTMMGRPKAQ